MVKINKTSVGYTATLEKGNGNKTNCVQKAASTFNESQRLCTKELLKWFKEGQNSKYIRVVLCLILDIDFSGLFALAGAAVQGGVEGAC